MRPLGQALIRSLRRTGGAEDTRPARPTDPIQGTRPVDPRVRPAERAPRPSSSQWIHLIGGAVVAVAGFFVFSGAVWARAVGIVLAALSAIANFLFIPYYPFWSLLMVALDVFVIWALARHGRQVAA